MDKAYAIMHKGAVHLNMFFTSEEKARNWIKMTYPKRRFKEPIHNKFICAYYGTTFTIVELSKHPVG